MNILILNGSPRHNGNTQLLAQSFAKGAEENPEVVVKADEKVKSSVIMSIMDAAQDAHYKKLIVAGEPLNKKEQKQLEDMQSSNTVNGASTALPQDNQYDNWSE